MMVQYAVPINTAPELKKEKFTAVQKWFLGYGPNPFQSMDESNPRATLHGWAYTWTDLEQTLYWYSKT